uniref:Uncharacterized protein n=1 Tax=Wuchereria bancrofti TaxID=6293 RepID=A0A1I8E9W0_WUCBA
GAEIATFDTEALSEKFLDTFVLKREENFDQYLEAKDLQSHGFYLLIFLKIFFSKRLRRYGWFMRQVIKLTGVTKMDNPRDIETYKYYRDSDYLIMKMACKGVSAKRYYKKQ